MKTDFFVRILGRTRVTKWILLGLLMARASAQPAPTPLANFWHPDAPVYALASLGDSLYLGGAFGYVGPFNGPLGGARLDSGAVSLQVPAVTGTVYAVAHDGAGNRYFGGSFVVAAGALTNLIRVFPWGSVDWNFRPNPDGAVRALAFGENHTLYVGGDFGKIAGSTRKFLTGLDPNTGTINAWGPVAQGSVLAMAVADDTVYLGGKFSSLGGQSRPRLAAVDALTGALKPWNPGASGGSAEVRTISVDGNTVYVGGVFTSCGGKPRNRIAALDMAGVATAWNPNGGSASGDAVNALVVIGPSIFVAGSFSSIGSLNRTNLAAVDLVSGLAVPTFEPQISGPVSALAALGNELIVGGRFSRLNDLPRRSLARLDAATGNLSPWEVPVSSLNSATTAAVLALAATDVELLIGGDFLSIGGVLRSRLAALNMTSGAATPWDPSADRDVYTLAASASAIYAGGLFTNVAGQARSRLAAVSPAGALLPFNPGVTATAANGVLTLALDGTKLYVGGNFTAVGPSNRTSLALLHLPDGLIDQWGPAVSGGAVRVVVPAASSTYVGGDFTSIAGASRPYLARLSTTGRGTNLSAFLPAPNGKVYSVLPRDNDLFVGGEFSTIGGQSRNRLARLDATTGAAAAAWNPGIGVSGQLRVAALLQSGPALYLGGTFSSAGGEFRNRLASLNQATAVATTWNPDVNQPVQALARAGGRLFVAGNFTTFGGGFVPYLAALDSGPHLLASAVQPDGGVQFDVTTGDGAGTTMSVEAASSLVNPIWETLDSFPVTGSTVTFDDPSAATKVSRFYRAVVE